MGRCPAAPRGAKSKTYVYELIAAASFEQEMKSVDQGVREIQRQIRRKKRKHFLHRHWPKFVTAIIGGAVFAASYFCSEAVQPLLVNIAAALISIPIVFLFYQMIDEKNHRNMIEYVYEYVDNHTFEIVDDAIDAVKVLLEGFSIFFDAGCADCGDGEFSTLLDQDIIVNADKKKLTTVFRLIPERIPLLGAQINEFLMWAERWRNA